MFRVDEPKLRVTERVAAMKGRWESDRRDVVTHRRHPCHGQNECARPPRAPRKFSLPEHFFRRISLPLG